MKVPVTRTMFTNLTCKLSKCVCVSDRMLSLSLGRFCLNVHLSINSTHCMGIYIPSTDVWSEGSDRWSEGSSIEYKAFEGSARTSKDELSRSIIRSISKHIFRGDRRIHIILRSLILRLRTSFNILQTVD
ncbi:hypothetical protein Hdeb2414_s0070g00772891 [Helianthus debilis subsp. tardiflorus]